MYESKLEFPEGWRGMGKVWTFSETTQFDNSTVESGFLKLLIVGTSRYLEPKVSSLS